ncbi:MAG: hypothetical protein KGH62_05785 [Candidatus Micrarchaeota archaeon]|nr:hypothetical protein [Candidatus Micrarchaeota archaeon]
MNPNQDTPREPESSEDLIELPSYKMIRTAAPPQILFSFLRGGQGSRIKGYQVKSEEEARTLQETEKVGGLHLFYDEPPDYIKIYYKALDDDLYEIYTYQVEPNGSKIWLDTTEPLRLNL